MSAKEPGRETGIKSASGSSGSGHGSRPAARVKLRIPGSTSNLGPGFDALGLALKIYTTISFTLHERDDPAVPLVTLDGQVARALPDDETNLVYQVVKKLWRSSSDLLARLRISIESEIPLCRGLGSSAAATLAAAWAAQALTGGTVDRQLALGEAAAIEGHPDNVAASLAGGLVVCGRLAEVGGIILKRLQWPEDWCTLVVVPNYPLPTKEARAVLPAQVPLADAVSNIQNVALLISAITTHDEVALGAALRDRIHEPYRDRLVPELAALRGHFSSLPILGCVLSGAGSSVLVVVNQRHQAAVLESLQGWAAMQKEIPQVLDLAVDQEGLLQIEDP